MEKKYDPCGRTSQVSSISDKNCGLNTSFKKCPKVDRPLSTGRDDGGTERKKIMLS